MRFIIFLILTYLAYKFLKGLFTTKETQRPHAPGPVGRSATGEDLVEDPYCHTYVPLSNAVKSIVEGKTVYFCSHNCLEKFKAIRE